MSTATTTDPLEHYERVLAEAQAAAEAAAIVAPVIIPLDLADIDGLEVTNIEVGDLHEAFELGPFAGNRYIRVRCDDLVTLATALRRRLADELQDAAFDERERKADAERVECPGCRTRIARDDACCGAPRCARIAAMEANV